MDYIIGFQAKLNYSYNNCKHLYIDSFSGSNATYSCQNRTDSAHSSVLYTASVPPANFNWFRIMVTGPMGRDSSPSGIALMLINSQSALVEYS